MVGALPTRSQPFRGVDLYPEAKEERLSTTRKTERTGTSTIRRAEPVHAHLKHAFGGEERERQVHEVRGRAVPRVWDKARDQKHHGDKPDAKDSRIAQTKK